ncbi:adhesion G protein-coupled receptor F5 isoform X1 [Mesocricetus auratus]|uniref:Adhesion G protein-coupled receptor F5 isoform X1 n=1 Tax=Mesocricetus auratus TaxID=10036 RepID=A0ABM2W4R0_MESAU|nr:adhesion G protein-coupled receptor F5 isoform X1 [Mesocricetus auratus]XP_040585452.1 adhesion G protein-coupled receptor F5 isoform X1 [Mesocricetus auratus]
MKALRTLAFCLVLIVTCSSEATRSTTVHPLILHDHELAGEEPVRQKRAAAVGGPVEEEYTVDIEISFENISFLESVKTHLNSLSFPIQGNSTVPATDIVSIAVTTVCKPAGNDLLCSCEKGYVWPRERCLHSLTCQEHDGALSGRSCSCLKGLPPQGPFCQLPDAYITLKIKVRLNIGFQEDLKNSSSALYRSYKTDLERAFREGYKTLPGFRSVTVTQFTKGSVVVNYEVQLKSAPLPGSIHKAHKQVTQSLNQTYRMDYNSFQGTPSNETKFTVTPEVIFEGDSVILECESEIVSSNASWYHGEKRLEIQSGGRFSIHTSVLNNMSLVSRLTIYNFTKQDAGEYRCKLTLDIFEYGDSRKLDVTPIRILAKEERKVVCDSNPISLNCCSENIANWSKIEWKQEGKIKILGMPETDLESSCSTYTLKADGTQCPSGSSGTTVTYTCEFVSPYGARGSKNIAVTFISVGDNSSYKGEVPESVRHVMEVSTVQSTTRNSLETSKAQEQQANLTITPDPISVSEGQSFSIACLSDVSNYDEVYWNTSAGIKIHPRFYTMRRYQDGAESVLTVKASTREWNGTYHCIFRYKNSYSVATKDVTVHPLPLESDIMMDPLEASGLCTSPHQFKCCVEEERGQEYSVTFHVDSSSFPAEREVNGKQACYKYSLPPNFLPRCPKNISVFCHFTNAANTSVRSPSMKLTLVPGENITCRDPVIGIGEPGKVIQKLCQFSSVSRSPGQIIGGTVTYKCVGSQWKEEKRTCISAPINGLLQLAKALIKSPSQDQKLPTYLRDLSVSAGKEEQDIRSSPGSLGAIINILDLLSTVPTQVNSEMMRDVLATINVILDKSALNSWEELLQQQSNQSSQFLHSVERFTKALQLGDNTPPFLFHPNVQMKSMVIKRGHPQVYQQKFVFADSDLWGDVAIDECQLANLQPDSSVVTVAFPTLKAILGKDAQKKTSSNSLVMTTTVSHSIIKPFRISMTFKNNHHLGGKPQCVFWNFSLDNYTGGWDGSGCTVEDDGRDNKDRVFCKCNHLTSFSILMSPDSPDPGSLLKVLLDIISYIGLGFSIFSLAACIVVEAMVWKSVTKNRTSYMRHICIVNIALCLLIADIWFIVASAIHDGHYPLNETACVAATFFIHFFYLSVFFWMLTLGLMLFYRLIFILHDAGKSTQKAIAFSLGYGCPLIISSITVGVTQPQEVYMRKNACWLNWEDTRALLAFAIPALIIVVVNVSITVVVITKILRPSIGDKPGKQEKSSLFQISKSIGVLTPLLGLTWGFGLATVIQGSNAVFHIIFTLLNAFQGLFILLFGCLWDQKVQEALLHKFSLSRWSSQHSKSTSLGSSTPVFSMSSPISRRFNNLFGKTGTYNVSTPETTSSSVENSSSAYSLLN